MCDRSTTRIPRQSTNCRLARAVLRDTKGRVRAAVHSANTRLNDSPAFRFDAWDSGKRIPNKARNSSRKIKRFFNI